MTVKYKVQTGEIRTQEQQSLLLASAAHRAWTEWCRTDGNGKMEGVQGQDEKLDQMMRFLYQQILENDVFYSGVSAGRVTDD